MSEHFQFDALALASAQHRRLILEEVKQLVSMSKAQIYRLAASGLFPKARKNGRSSRWVLGEVVEYLQRQEASHV